MNGTMNCSLYLYIAGVLGCHPTTPSNSKETSKVRQEVANAVKADQAYGFQRPGTQYDPKRHFLRLTIKACLLGDETLLHEKHWM